MNSDPIDLLVKLIKCKSVTPNDDGALAVIENILKKNNFKSQRLTFGTGQDKVENLFLRLGSKRPHLCFAGHTDVVPAGDYNLWEHSPFGGDIEGNKIFGRGAVDMKGAIASFASAVINWIKDNKKFTGSISFLLTGDEEGPAINGTSKVLKWMDENNENDVIPASTSAVAINSFSFPKGVSNGIVISSPSSYIFISLLFFTLLTL